LTSIKSGWQDSNLRPPAPKAGAIPGYATPRNYGITFFPLAKDLRLTTIKDNTCLQKPHLPDPTTFLVWHATKVKKLMTFLSSQSIKIV
jgi:hypothetical protein